MRIMWKLLHLALVWRAILPTTMADDLVHAYNSQHLPDQQRDEPEARRWTIPAGTPIAALESCDDLPSDGFGLSGIYLVMSSVIECPEMKMVHVKKNTVITSENSIELNNVHFVVYPGLHFVLHSKKAIKVTRAKGSTTPLLSVFGSAHFDPNGWDESFNTGGGNDQDTGGLVLKEKDGTVANKIPIRYSDDSMVAMGAIPTAKKTGAKELQMDSVDRNPTTAANVRSIEVPSERENNDDEVNEVSNIGNKGAEKALTNAVSHTPTSCSSSAQAPAITTPGIIGGMTRRGENHNYSNLSTVYVDPDDVDVTASAAVTTDGKPGTAADVTGGYAGDEASTANISKRFPSSITSDAFATRSNSEKGDRSLFDAVTGASGSPTERSAGQPGDRISSARGGFTKGFFKAPVSRKTESGEVNASDGIKVRVEPNPESDTALDKNAPSDGSSRGESDCTKGWHIGSSCKTGKKYDIGKDYAKRCSKDCGFDNASVTGSDHSIDNLGFFARHAPPSPILSSSSNPQLKLRVGEELTGRLETLDGHAAISPSDDGSILHHKRPVPVPPASSSPPAHFPWVSRVRRTPTTYPVGDGGDDSAGSIMSRQTDGSVMTSAVLVPSKRHLIRRGLVLLREILEWTEREMGVGVDGGWKARHNVFPSVVSVLNVAWKVKEQRISKHPKKIAMTIDDRGCLHVDADRKCVLTKSGPRRWDWTNRFPWRRPQNQGYELYPSEDGLEIRLEGKVIWGVRRKVRHEERVIRGVEAEDIFD